MKATGIVRRIDDLGRVVIPKEIRRTMRIREGDPLEIYTDRDGGVIFRKYSQLGDVSEFAAQLCETVSRVAGIPAVITDRDSCIAAGGLPRREVVDKRISRQVEQLMEERQAVRFTQRTAPLCEGDERYRVLVAVPILTEGDVLGCVMFVTDKDLPPLSEVELKLAQAVAGIMGKHMES
ncbi:MAG: stage V sporulation T C-terminal domain-containing protein [Oscillospiraceae bacterium]|nr:stage V sporulation T C-terminal domain-containing protein [Oscillospiraceae bacterium]